MNSPLHGGNEREFYRIVLWVLARHYLRPPRRHTQKEIAQKIGLSRRRIGQILESALAKMRLKMKVERL